MSGRWVRIVPEEPVPAKLGDALLALAEHWGGVDDDRRKLVALAAQAQELERDAARYR